MEIINSNLNFRGSLVYNNTPKMVILHHADAERCTIQDINMWHIQNGWAGCGYHYFVSKDGRIYTGRSEKAEGAHCLNYNTESIGICAEGNFNNDKMGDAQYNALKQITQSMLSKYGLNKVYGHRELYSTDCPGKNFPLDRIREDLMSFLIGKNGPGYNLKMNENKFDGNVKLFQEKLISMGYDLGKSGADGYFGRETLAAVIKFQRANELIVDGIVGEKTWGKIMG